jgi:hypothetical protein
MDVNEMKTRQTKIKEVARIMLLDYRIIRIKLSIGYIEFYAR